MTQLKLTQRQHQLLLLGLLLLPWFGLFRWGRLADAAYGLLGNAQQLAMGRELTMGNVATLLVSPLQTAVFTLLAWLGLPLETAALAFACLGWSLFLYQLWHATKSTTTAAVLLAASPLLLATAGLATSWWLTWLLLFLLPQQRYQKRPFLLALLLLTHFDAATLVLIVGLWLTIPANKWRSGLLLMMLAAAWLLWVHQQLGMPLLLNTLVQLQPGTLPTVVAQLWRESQLYLFYLPLLLLGLAKPPAWLPLGWLGAWLLWGSLVGSPTVGWLTAVLVYLLVAGGLHNAIARLRAEPNAQRWLLALGCALLFWPQLATWQQRSQLQQSVPQQLEAAVASWLRQNSPPEAAVWAAPRLQFLANRPLATTAVLPTAPAQLPDLLNQLDIAPPRYMVEQRPNNLRTPSWDFLTRTGWFRERYETAVRLGDGTMSYVIWAYRESGFDAGEKQPLAVTTDHGINLVAAQIAPERVQPGEPIFVTLQLAATRPITTAFQTVVRAIAPLDGVGWAQLDDLRPTSRPLGWWRAGDLISERFMLTMPADLPVGLYEINVSFHDVKETAFWPLRLDDVELEAVVVGKTAVAWQGDFGEATSINATFGDQIRLAAAAVQRDEATLSVTLFWEALRQPAANYTVFVQLLNAANERVAGHDGQPLNGRFPTAAWLPNEQLADSHSLALPANLAAGSYQLKVGLYLLETGERLPVWNAAGQEQPDRAIELTTLSFP